MEKKELYHIITLSSECGWDEKPEAQTLSEAIRLAKEYLADDYDEVKIYHRHELKRYCFKNRKGKVLNMPQKELPLLQASWEAREHGAQATETPQISTETADVENVSAEGENTAERAKYRVYRKRCPYGYKIALADTEQCKVIGILLTIEDKTTIETQNTIGQQPFNTDKPISELTDEEIIATIAPTPSETPPAKDLSTDTEKTPQRADKTHILAS